jgi:tRNA-modifying protein YgfZ
MPDHDTAPLVCDLPPLATLRFSGDDARAFLQGQLTCDVSGLAPDRSVYGAYCTPKGRMLANFLLWSAEGAFLMQAPAALREPLQKRLSMYILRSRVKAEDASGNWVAIGVAGKGAAELVRDAVGVVPDAMHGVAHRDSATVLHLPVDRYEILARREVASRIKEALAKEAAIAEPEFWEWLDVRAGVPTIAPETQEEFVPQMANLDLIGGVSFSKGCYPGQEIVARMHYRGTLKQRMYLATTEAGARPQPGDKLYSPAFGKQACGTIVNAAASPEGGIDTLAVIQIAAAEQGDIRWKLPDGPALTLLTLPYPLPA